MRAGRPYDLVFANILARPLCAMARDLAAHLAPGGTAILAGLLGTQARMVLAAHRRQGLVLERAASNRAVDDAGGAAAGLSAPGAAARRHRTAASAPARAICASCADVTPDTPIAPMIRPPD